MTPQQPLIEDAAIVVDGDVIIEVGPFADLSNVYGTEYEQLEGTVCPGLINAHSHLELAHVRGETIPGKGFVPWVENLLSLNIFELDDKKLRREIEEMRKSGTVMVGDIATRFASQMAGFLQESGLFFVVFAEAIGEPAKRRAYFPSAKYDNGWFSAAGHSLYTTHADVLREAKAVTREQGLVYSIHLAEHADECAIMAGEPSEFLDMLQSRGRLLDFKAPGMRPVEYAEKLGLLDETTLAVHCVCVTDEDIETLRRSGCTVCLCPRSNKFIGVGRSPWEKYMEAGISCCLGTDSLASNWDLNLWNEARYFVERYEGDISLVDVISMLTRNPAKILGADKFGSIEKGKLAYFVTIPEDFLALFPGVE